MKKGIKTTELVNEVILAPCLNPGQKWSPKNSAPQAEEGTKRIKTVRHQPIDQKGSAG